MHVLASTIGQIFAPIFHAMSWLLAVYYSLIPDYVVAIAMLTVTVMIISFPLNRASTRSMFKMQLLQPEVQKLRNKYKPSRDMSVQERQEVRQKLNEEMMALYRENNVSMAGGCLPNLVIFPIFIVLYDTIRGLTNTCTAVVGQSVCASSAALKTAKHTTTLWAPRYIIKGTKLYANLAAAKGKMLFLGINLADTVRTPQKSWVDVLPFVAFVLVAIALQYIQLRQMSGRNTQTGQVAQQMQAMQKFMPLIMAVIYISIPVAVNVYFIFSSLFRIGQQEWMYKRDPQIRESFAKLKARRAAGGGSGGATPKGGAAGGRGGAPAKGGPAGGRGRSSGADAEEIEPARAPLPPGGMRGFRTRLANALAPPDGVDGTGGGAGGNGSSNGPARGGSRSGGQARSGTTGRTSSGGAKSGGGSASGGGASGRPAGGKPAGGKPANGTKPAGGTRQGGGARSTTNGSSQDAAADDSGGDTEGKRQRRPK